jgi:hypothetical protein
MTLSKPYNCLSCDEVTTIDNGWWICVHAYVIDCWSKVPILVCLDTIVDRSCSNNLTQVIMNALLKCSDWLKRNFLINYCVLEQIGECISRWENKNHKRRIHDHLVLWVFKLWLVIRSFGNLTFIARIETFVIKMHGYFSHSPKGHLDFRKRSRPWKWRGIRF